MDADQDNQILPLMNCLPRGALALLVCWLFTGAPIALAQPPGDGVMLLSGVERSEYVAEPEPGACGPKKTILLRGTFRSEYIPQWGADSAWETPTTNNLVPPPRLDPVAFQAPPVERNKFRSSSGTSSVEEAERPRSNREHIASQIRAPSPAPTASTLGRLNSERDTPSDPTRREGKVASHETGPASAVRLAKKENDKPQRAPTTAMEIPPPRLSAGATMPPGKEGSRASERQVVLPGNFLYKFALVQLISHLATLALAVVIFVGVFLRLLRRYGSSLDALRRLDPACYGSATKDELLPPLGLGNEARSHNAGTQSFDLGLTYAEESRLREEAMRQQETAILRQIVEDNVRLRAEIGALDAAAA